MSAVVKGACTTCHGSRQLVVRVNRGRRAEVECPTCGGTGEVDRCAACREPLPHTCKLMCDREIGAMAICGAPTLGAVTLGAKWWARCEDHGGLEAAEDARRRETDPRWHPDQFVSSGLERTADRHDLHHGRDIELVPGVTVAAAAAKLMQPVTKSAELDAAARDLFDRAAAEPPPGLQATPIEPTAPPLGPIVIDEPPAPAPAGQLIVPDPPPITSNKRRRKKPPTSAPAIAHRRRGPSAPELPGIPDHHDAPWCGCDRCWGDA